MTDRLLDEVFRRSATAMVLVDDAGVYVDANPAAEQLLRYPRPTLIGRTLLDLVVPEERAALASEVARFAAENRTVTDHGIRTFLLGDGRQLALCYSRSMHVGPDLNLGVYTLPVDGDRDPVRLAHVGRPTRRELEVISLLALGATGEQIATRLVVSPETVRTHIRNAMEKLGASTRAHLIAIAVRERLISL